MTFMGGCCCGPVSNQVSTVLVFGRFSDYPVDVPPDNRLPGDITPDFSPRIQSAIQRCFDTLATIDFPSAGTAVVRQLFGGTEFNAVAQAPPAFNSDSAGYNFPFRTYPILDPTWYPYAFARKSRYFRTLNERACVRRYQERSVFSQLDESILISTTILPAGQQFDTIPQMPTLRVPCDFPVAGNYGCDFFHIHRVNTTFESQPAGCPFP